MMDKPPHIILLEAIAAAGAGVDYLADAGIAGNVTVRHSRNRKVHDADKPCFTIVFVDDDDLPPGDQRNEWEQPRRLQVDIQADIDIATEDSGEDPTGLLVISRFLAAFVRSLKDPLDPVWLGNLCDSITYGALDPSDRSTPDRGRMTREINVLYRVRSDDPNVLLAQGVNG